MLEFRSTTQIKEFLKLFKTVIDFMYFLNSLTAIHAKSLESSLSKGYSLRIMFKNDLQQIFDHEMALKCGRHPFHIP